MKRSGFKQKLTKPMKRTRIRVAGHSTTADQKKEIQRLVREIVIKRDGGCILRNIKSHKCNGYRNDGELILQADHLISRSNSATYGDTRLIVCLCKGAHGWKSVGSNLRKVEYDELVRSILPKERVDLWDRCEQEKYKPTRVSAYDWGTTIIALKQELEKLN